MVGRSKWELKEGRRNQLELFQVSRSRRAVPIVHESRAPPENVAPRNCLFCPSLDFASIVERVKARATFVFPSRQLASSLCSRFPATELFDSRPFPCPVPP